MKNKLKGISLSLRDTNHILLITVFALITALTMFFKCDDFALYYSITEPELEFAIMPNGRYFTNILTIFILRHPVIRCIFITAVLTAGILLLGKLVNFSGKQKRTACLFSLLMLIMMPKDTYAETVNWISGLYKLRLFVSLIICLYLFFLCDSIQRTYAEEIYCCGNIHPRFCRRSLP